MAGTLRAAPGLYNRLPLRFPRVFPRLVQVEKGTLVSGPAEGENGVRLTVLCLLAYLATGWLPPRIGAQPAAAPGGTAAPCRTTALATVPQMFAQDGAVATSESASVERFYIAVTCDAEHAPGDYQVWWKASLASPSSSARLVAIINEQTEVCAAEC